MVQADILTAAEQVELLNGEIVEMSQGNGSDMFSIVKSAVRTYSGW